VLADKLQIKPAQIEMQPAEKTQNPAGASFISAWVKGLCPFSAEKAQGMLITQ
jgi:hypothetical protein